MAACLIVLHCAEATHAYRKTKKESTTNLTFRPTYMLLFTKAPPFPASPSDSLANRGDLIITSDNTFITLCQCCEHSILSAQSAKS